MRRARGRRPRETRASRGTCRSRARPMAARSQSIWKSLASRSRPMAARNESVLRHSYIKSAIGGREERERPEALARRGRGRRPRERCNSTGGGARGATARGGGRTGPSKRCDSTGGEGGVGGVVVGLGQRSEPLTGRDGPTAVRLRAKVARARASGAPRNHEAPVQREVTAVRSHARDTSHQSLRRRRGPTRCRGSVRSRRGRYRGPVRSRNRRNDVELERRQRGPISRSC